MKNGYVPNVLPTILCGVCIDFEPDPPPAHVHPSFNLRRGHGQKLCNPFQIIIAVGEFLKTVHVFTGLVDVNRNCCGSGGGSLARNKWRLYDAVCAYLSGDDGGWLPPLFEELDG